MPVSAEHQLLAEPVRVQLPAQLRATPDQLLLQEPGDSLFLSLRTLEDPHFRRMQAALQLLSVVHSPQLLETADAFALRLFPHHGRSLYHVLVSVLRIARPLPSPRILILLSSLQKLSLSHCSQLSGEFAITVVKNCSQLRCLDISHCRHKTPCRSCSPSPSRSWTSAASPPSPTTRCASSSPTATSSRRCAWSPRSPSLSSSHSAVSDELLAQLLRRCRRLVSLSVANSPGVGDRALMSLARRGEGCPFARRRCTAATADG